MATPARSGAVGPTLLHDQKNGGTRYARGVKTWMEVTTMSTKAGIKRAEQIRLNSMHHGLM